MLAYINEKGEWVFNITPDEATERLKNGLNVWKSDTPDSALIQIYEHE